VPVAVAVVAAAALLLAELLERVEKDCLLPSQVQSDPQEPQSLPLLETTVVQDLVEEEEGSPQVTHFLLHLLVARAA